MQYLTGHQSSEIHGHCARLSGSNAVLHDHEFSQLREMIYQIAGISMSPAKKPLVSSRLAKRHRHHNFPRYGEYLNFINSAYGKAELQNVMIYFDQETKRRVVSKLLPLLRPGGYFIIGHAESLNGVTDQVKLVAPAVYRKPACGKHDA